MTSDESNEKIIDTLSSTFNSGLTFEKFGQFVITKETRKCFKSLYNFHTQFPDIPLNHIIPNLSKNKLIAILKRFQKETELSTYSKGFAIFCKILILNFRSSNNYFIYELFIKYFKLNQKNDVIIYLLNSNFEIFQNFILNIIENIRFFNCYKSISPNDAINVLQQIIEPFPNFLLKNELLLDEIVENLHNFILNVKNNSANFNKLIEKTLNLLIELQSLAFNQDNLVTCTNIDNILQFYISTGKFNIKDYIISFEGKDLTWIENSLLSIDNLLFADLDDISFSTESKNINWPLVMKYLNFYSLVVTQSNETKRLLPISILRPLYETLLKISKLINIPESHNCDFKKYFCTIISYAYKFNLTPFDHIRYFSILLSYLSFSPDSNIRKKSFDTINEILNWDKNNIISKSFKYKDPDNFKEIFINLISDYKNEINCILLFKRIQHTIDNNFRYFNFVGLLQVFFNFDNLFVIEKYINTISGYTKSLKQLFLKEIENSNEFDSYFKFYITSIIQKKIVSNELRYEVIPIYPNCSKKQIRMYLYILYIYKYKQLDDKDLMILDMFRFDDDDIISFFIKIFDSYKLNNSIIKGLIECLSNQNLILLSIFKCSLKLYYNLLVDKDKFKLINACVIGEKSKNVLFIKFFSEIVQSDEQEISDLHPFYNILKIIGVPYLSWQLTEKLSFWQEIMKIAITLDLVDVFIGSFDAFLESLGKCKNYVAVTPTMVIPLTVNEVEKSTAEQFRRLISIKIQAFKNNTESNLKLVKKVKLQNIIAKSPDKKSVLKRNQSIVKNQNVYSDLIENDIPVSITIYPNGKLIEDKTNDLKEKNPPKLNFIERKKLFLTQVSVNGEYKLTINGTRLIITRYSDHLIKIIINDIFKGLFKTYRYIGEMIGIMFNSKLSFKTEDDKDIFNCLLRFKINNNKITDYLFIKLAFYLIGRNLTSDNINNKIEKLGSSNSKISLFIQEEEKLI